MIPRPADIITLDQIKLKTDPKTGKYVLLIDATGYKESNCLRRTWFQLIRGIRTEGRDHKQEYGVAFHKALDLFYRLRASGIDYNLAKTTAEAAAMQYYSNPAIIVPESDFRHIGHLMLTLKQYFQTWGEHDGLKPKLNSLGEPMVEARFAYPYYASELIDVIIVGIIDMIGNNYSTEVIVDHKTTAISTVDSYLSSYIMSPQLMLYKDVCDHMFPTTVSRRCMINGIFLNRTGKNTFKRSEMFEFTDDQMSRFRQQFQHKVIELVAALTDAIKNKDITMFAQNSTCCEGKFGMCQFLPLCLMEKPDDIESVIKTSFTTRCYDPETFNQQ